MPNDTLSMILTPAEAARVAKVAAGTLASWRSRGKLPGGDYTFRETLNLSVAVQLAKWGVPIMAVAEVASGLDEAWPRVMSKSVHDRPLYLLLTRGQPGDTAFLWDVLGGDELVERYTDGALILNLSRTVLAALAAVGDEAGEETGNGSFIVNADPLPLRRGRALA